MLDAQTQHEIRDFFSSRFELNGKVEQLNQQPRAQ
jgi:hypothetical protein